MKRISLLSFSILAALLLPASQGAAQWRRMPPAKWLPAYHYYPSGDPTGLFYFGGKYYENWGRASSSDFVHWTFTKQHQARLGGSGSVVVDWDNSSGLGIDGRPPLLSFWHNEVQPLREQVIGMAYSNDTARTWTRYKTFPILRIHSREFRDPKIFWYAPDKKWVMAIGWAEVPKIMFFQSKNLKDWTYMSAFGPWGATNGVWECTDFFPLPVDGDVSRMKWVLVMGVQPFSEQYFIGNFDGTRFVMDSDFVALYSRDRYEPKGQVLFNFEHGLDNWTMQGDAFSESPACQGLYRQGSIMGKEGQFYLNSFHKEASSMGTITSPAFTVSKDYLDFKIGGGYAPGKECVNLIVNGKTVRTATGHNSNNLQWTGWDVSAFRGQQARLQFVDSLSEGYGCIFADQFVLSDEKAFQEREKSLWVDYGSDFYALRSWNNYAPGEKRRIWLAWMSSWRYAGDEPLSGVQSVPREVKLKTFPEGIRLVQQPIRELQSLRGKHFHEGTKTIEGVWKDSKFKPSRNAYELIADFELGDAEEFGLNLCVGKGERTVIGYNVPSETLYVDRRHSGDSAFSGLFARKDEGPLKNRNGKCRLHIFVDRCSVEVFGNDGETVLSEKIYPDASSLGIEFFANNGKVTLTSADLYELGDIPLYQQTNK
ncbi:MAG: GH32 C-terminal domain-containing protein [Tannerella sp.]|jgi:sucrose-6-phosphate hydrolase SacC (GH32 family)|nr:GH32 C-terminal domain-containing protein [Tannerella sp.]